MLRSLLCALTLAAATTAQVSYYSASLDGTQEVPANGSTGRGWAVVRLEEPANTVRIFVHTEGLTAAAVAAHLHLAAVGVNGGIIVPLAGGPATWTGAAIMPAAQVAALKTSGTYLNVHTPVFPGGEVRGQVVASRTLRFTTLLTGAQEVPPTPSGGTGEGVAFLHQPDNRLVYTVRTQGVLNVTAAHIHQAPAGVNGGVIHPLMGGNGQYCGVTDKLTSSQLAALFSNGLYFNVHTTAFGGGEIRGQIMLTRGDDFHGRMSGNQEVPPNASAGAGKACIQIQPDGSVRYRVQVNGLSGPPVAAHVHVAPAGVNGGIVFPLAGGPAVFSGTSPVLTTAQLLDCRTGNWYANVHTALFPGGELRGQLQPLDLPTVFGGSCRGSNGVSMQIAADGAACLAGSVRVDGHGTLPGTAAILSLGFSRDGSGGGALPQEFTNFGLPAPNCFFLISPATSLLVFADPEGCAHHTINIPFAPALVGLTVYGQWFAFDATANPFGLISSNAITLVVQ